MALPESQHPEEWPPPPSGSSEQAQGRTVAFPGWVIGYDLVVIFIGVWHWAVSHGASPSGEVSEYQAQWDLLNRAGGAALSLQMAACVAGMVFLLKGRLWAWAAQRIAAFCQLAQLTLYCAALLMPNEGGIGGLLIVLALPVLLLLTALAFSAAKAVRRFEGVIAESRYR